MCIEESLTPGVIGKKDENTRETHQKPPYRLVPPELTWIFLVPIASTIIVASLSWRIVVPSTITAIPWRACIAITVTSISWSYRFHVASTSTAIAVTTTATAEATIAWSVIVRSSSTT